MERMLGKHGLEFEYMLENDIPDLTGDFLDAYFAGDFCKPTPVSSCASKHLRVFEKMIAENIPEALVLEDDIYLKKKFRQVLRKSRQEMAEMVQEDTPFWVGFEASCLKIVPFSRRKKGQVAYLGNMIQCMGAYYLNRAMAKLIVDTAHQEKISIPIDWYVDSIRARGTDAFYWSYPPVAEQGSHTGLMRTSLGGRQKNRLKKYISRRTTLFFREVAALLR